MQTNMPIAACFSGSAALSSNQCCDKPSTLSILSCSVTPHKDDGILIRICLIPQCALGKCFSQRLGWYNNNPADLVFVQHVKCASDVDQVYGVHVFMEKIISKRQRSSINERWDAPKNEITTKSVVIEDIPRDIRGLNKINSRLRSFRLRRDKIFAPPGRRRNQ